ncbi:MAG: NADH-quinone oxidoreductase subunit G [Chromatiaceae bacterium]|nr:MAG: NADH-quinone oxidoreductase subunit G [Chromatiaceae bacterium]
MSDQITVEIDGRACAARPGEMIIAVADREGIVIPRFCYHEKLSIAANCRMCLVEAEQGGRPFPKPVPACATPVGDGMKVWTHSPKALEAQRGTMEFLLINHPLDCPICDQGGECELQDTSMGYGEDVSRFSERKRVVKDEDLGPLIATDMTRCIHCTRCVRFTAEIAGVRELGATGRGEDMRIGTFVEHTVAHELSGNVIDLCPVGALTSKPYRFTARAWELTAEDSIAPHDGVGANISLHIRGGQVMRVHPRVNEQVNETWISDRDRFSYEGLNSSERLTTPMVRRDGVWHEVEWPEALAVAAAHLQACGAGQLGALIAPNATLEEQYLLARLVRGLGSDNLDTRLRQQDFRGDALDPRLPWLGLPIAELEQARAVLIIGSDIRHEQPLLAHRIRKAALSGAAVALINPYRIALNHPHRQQVAPPGCLIIELAALAKALGASATALADKVAAAAVKAVTAALDRAKVTADHRAMASLLQQAGSETGSEPGRTNSGLVLLGALAEADPDYALLRELARLIATLGGCRVGMLARAANSPGSWLAGSLPHRQPGGAQVARPGLDALAMLADPRQGYLLWGIDPERDLVNPALARAALSRAEHVVACSAFHDSALEAIADVLLPIGAFSETAGTFVNAELRWQRFQGAVAPPGEARPGWKVLRVLGQSLGIDGFGYNSAREIHDELAAVCGSVSGDNRPCGDLSDRQMADRESSAAPQGLELTLTVPAADSLIRIGNLPIYASDPLVRRAPALQRTPLAEPCAAHLHPAQAAALGLAAGDQVRLQQPDMPAPVIAPVVLDDAVPPGCVRVPAAVDGSQALGAQIGPITLEPITTTT